MRRLAVVCWTILLAVVAGRLLVQTNLRNTVFDIFTTAGRCWIEGRDPYGDWTKYFRYSPTAAAAFAPWTLLPERAAEILWRTLTAIVFVAGFLSFLRKCVPSFDAARRWAAVLGSLPLAVMSVNNGQTNILLAGLLFFAFADAQRERWNRCAAALAAAVFLKLWPIAAAGLMIVCFPKKLGPRFAVAMIIGLMAPFLFQRWEYVVSMHRSWMTHLASDTRMDLNPLLGNRDFWLVFRVLGVPIDAPQYVALQLASAATLAAWIGWLRWRGTPSQEFISLIALAGCVWMLGFGPATESCTYSLIGPLLAWAWLDPSRSRESRAERILLLTSCGLFAISLASVITPYSRLVESFGFQPIGAALLFLRLLIAGRPVRMAHAIVDRRKVVRSAFTSPVSPLRRRASPAAS